MKVANFFLLSVLFIKLIGIAQCNLQLKMLHVVFRDKVSQKEFQTYPNDPHKNYTFLPIEDGGLTHFGMMREYKIGALLRENYSEYFGTDYLPSLMYAKPTELTRAKMSLQLVLAGLFPPSKIQTWNPTLPVEFIFFPISEDYLISIQSCPKYNEEYNRFIHRPEVKKMVEQYREIFDYLTTHTGKQIKDTYDVQALYVLLIEQIAQNLTLPKWTEKVFPNPMTDIVALENNLRSFTTTLKRLNGGLLLRKITDDMKKIQNGTLDPLNRKAFFFLSHDITIISLSRTLGLKEPKIADYGSTFIFETLRNEENEYFVRVIFWTGVTEKYLPQTIPGCEELCPLNQFLKLLKDVIYNDDEHGCYRTNLISSANLHSRFYGPLQILFIILLSFYSF